MPVLDATAGNRHIWKGDMPTLELRDEHIIFADIELELKVPPDIFCDNTRLPFRNKVFDEIIYDPPHHQFGSSDLFGDPKERKGSFWGNFKSKKHLKQLLKGGSRELHRVLKLEGDLHVKWCESPVTWTTVSKYFRKLWQLKKYTVRNTRSGHNPKRVYWIHLNKRSEIPSILTPVLVLNQEVVS